MRPPAASEPDHYAALRIASAARARAFRPAGSKRSSTRLSRSGTGFAACPVAPVLSPRVSGRLSGVSTLLGRLS